MMDRFAFIETELARIGEIATAGYFLALRNRGTSPLLTYRTYPQAWIDLYTEKGYVLRDPITTWALTVGGTIRWSSPMLPDPFRIFQQAARHGLIYGASIAHGPLKSLTICSFSRSDREFTDDEIEAVRKIVFELHERTKLPESLEEDQRAILRIFGEGRTMKDVVARTGMAEPAIRTRLNHLCDLLLAKTPAEAVQRARDYKLL
ncbi:MAG: autoinducer binding domain-containing protein [Paracoccaceae bacterium]|nr:MAG: autoinducer binding domain-containing protein [Paracoccaceae bacterium]